MPRKGSISKRKINSDPKFGELSVAKFINYLMVDGKKRKSEKIFYESLEVASKKLNKDPLEIFQTAMLGFNHFNAVLVVGAETPIAVDRPRTR